jgi:hypothetical protein
MSLLISQNTKFVEQGFIDCSHLEGGIPHAGGLVIVLLENRGCHFCLSVVTNFFKMHFLAEGKKAIRLVLLALGKSNPVVARCQADSGEVSAEV